MRKIETYCHGQTSWACGNFYHVVEIYADDIKVDEKHVHGCEDNEEASYYAVSISNALTQEEKYNYEF